MSVELDPVELGFKRPFTQEVSQVLRLKNPNSDPVAFKVKTTAPKQYCVRPNSGRIDAGKEVEVQVLLQAMKEDPPLDARCRDKFLVQSVAVSPDQEFSNSAQIWGNVDKAGMGSIQEKKIRVVFLPADDTSTAGRPVNGTGVSNGVYPSPSPEAVTPSRSATAAVGSVPRPESRPADSKSLGDAVSSASNPATSNTAATSVISSAAAGVASVVPTSTDILKTQLAEAKAQIARLTQQAQEQGLRQRKTDVVNQDSKERITSGSTGMGVQQTPASGVPVQIVAGLCLLSFLLAYFFF